jgi:hypothetical protein
MEDEEEDASYVVRFCGRGSAFSNHQLADCLASRVSDMHAIKVNATRTDLSLPDEMQ